MWRRDYVIYEFWHGDERDHVTMMMKILRDRDVPFSGRGKDFGNACFPNFRVDMTFDEVLRCSWEALVEISVNDVCCGGMLTAII
ncbi:hypothetical protein CASFOL_009657 [Castilleja foliolosa]|uniref:Uncharacterized protein n=1 Tax=Castilleja foliolosa TaxID=1961234 RepID=A0ABD3DSN9_9LAMI